MGKQTKKTNYTGNSETATKVRSQIEERFGKIEAKKYNPFINCRTFNNWLKNGFRVKHGQRSLKSFVIISFKDKNGKVIKKRKTINLFYVLQVEALK